jgi:hypothetical protein
VFCQTRRNELKLICLARYCSCSRFRTPGHSITSWHSTSHDFTYQSIMSLSCFQPVHQSRQGEIHDSVFQIDAHSYIKST